MESLAREVILQHYRKSSHRGTLPSASHVATATNEICGDRVTIELRIVDSCIEEVRFAGQGCSVSQASASMVAKVIEGKNVAEADAVHADFRALMAGEGATPRLGDLRTLEGVRKFPNRVRCAFLGWEAYLKIRDSLPPSL